MEIIPGDRYLASKVIIYEQPLGYVYNSYAKAKHTLTWSTTYKCYDCPKQEFIPEVKVASDSTIANMFGESLPEVTQTSYVPQIPEVLSPQVIENEDENDNEDGDLSSSASQEAPETETKFEKKARKIITRIFAFLD